jgi:hypothetical protein
MAFYPSAETSFLYPPGVPVAIHTFSGRFAGAAAWSAFGVGGAIGSGAWPAANLALYLPFVMPFNYPVKRVFWYNGATAAGTWDIGIYRAATLGRIASTGATTQTGTNVVQFVTLDVMIPPGEYYFGLSASSGSSTAFRNNGFNISSQRVFGCLEESSAHPLPATMTPVTTTRNYMPVAGLTRFASFP